MSVTGVTSVTDLYNNQTVCVTSVTSLTWETVLVSRHIYVMLDFFKCFDVK